MTEFQEEQSESTRALKPPIMTSRSKAGTEESVDVVGRRKHWRDQQFGSRIGRISGSINRQDRNVGQMAFQAGLEYMFGHRLKDTPRSFPSNLSLRTEEDCHTMSVGGGRARVQDGSAMDICCSTTRPMGLR